MELYGKKVNFLGDSITAGCCASSPDLGYVNLLKEKCRLSEARNYGIGGTRIARQQRPSAQVEYDADFCSRVHLMDPDADVIVVFGGTNDHGHGDAPMGTNVDRTPDTFYGACHFLFQFLNENYPKTTIVVLTPLHRVEDNMPKENGGWILKDYVDAIRYTANRFQLPILDLFKDSQLQIQNPDIASKFTTDGLHPNDAGHAILAEEIHAFLKSL